MLTTMKVALRFSATKANPVIALEKAGEELIWREKTRQVPVTKFQADVRNLGAARYSPPPEKASTSPR